MAASEPCPAILPFTIGNLFQTHTLRRVGPVDKTGFIEFPHDARVDHFFGLDLADLWIAGFEHSLHVAQAIYRKGPGLGKSQLGHIMETDG